ncbi:MAG: DUF134 domain-containing protein [Bacteroidales bacterium]|nr:DUF134 domain-containing protein [Bacteroidales bacterium]
MPRRKRMRKVAAPPGFRGYKPYGNRHGSKEHVDLLYEEYEAIKLADYQLMNHQEASHLMGVSRATFARVYESARRKIARALVETREIRSVFGNASLDHSWFACEDCETRFNIPDNLTGQHCPLCKSENIHSIKEQI